MFFPKTCATVAEVFPALWCRRTLSMHTDGRPELEGISLLQDGESHSRRRPISRRFESTFAPAFARPTVRDLNTITLARAAGGACAVVGAGFTSTISVSTAAHFSRAARF